jgi:hypothetical protein
MPTTENNDQAPLLTPQRERERDRRCVYPHLHDTPLSPRSYKHAGAIMPNPRAKKQPSRVAELVRGSVELPNARSGFLCATTGGARCVREGRACGVCATAGSPQQPQGHGPSGPGPRSGSAVLRGSSRPSGLCDRSTHRIQVKRLVAEPQLCTNPPNFQWSLLCVVRAYRLSGCVLESSPFNDYGVGACPV